MNVEEIANLRSFVNEGLNNLKKVKRCLSIRSGNSLDHQIPDEWFYMEE